MALAGHEHHGARIHVRLRPVVHVLLEAVLVDVSGPPHGLRVEIAEERLALRELHAVQVALAIALVEERLVGVEVLLALGRREDAVRVERPSRALRSHAVASMKTVDGDGVGWMRRASRVP